VRCSRPRASSTQTIEHRATITALRAAARRALALEAKAHNLEIKIALLVGQVAPQLLAEPGVGPNTAAQILNAYSHPGRFRSEGGYPLDASLGGAAPIPASSGQTIRYRLNRGGDRQLNRALRTIVLSRLTHQADTRAYVQRRSAEGKTPREIKRCLKRYLARRIYRLLEAIPELVPIPATSET